MIPIPPAAILAAVLMLAPLQPAVRAVATSEVQPPPSTVYVAPTARCGEWWQLAVEVGWPTEELPTVDRVMWCESNCTPTAYHPRYGASGLMQVLSRYFSPGADPFDPATNLAEALDVWHAQGWRAWSCY